MKQHRLTRASSKEEETAVGTSPSKSLCGNARKVQAATALTVSAHRPREMSARNVNGKANADGVRYVQDLNFPPFILTI
jgi:hypothetical protein